MSNEKKPPQEEIVIPVAATEDGLIGLHKHEDGTSELRQLHYLQEGKPIPSNIEDIEFFEPRGDGTYKPMGKGGPAQVATKSYRDNWEAVFAKKTDVN